MSAPLDDGAAAAIASSKEEVGNVAPKGMDEVEMVVARVQRLQIDDKYEFSAPKYFDFSSQETELDVEAAEHWFDTAVTYDPSPHVARAKWIAEAMFMHTDRAAVESQSGQQKTGQAVEGFEFSNDDQVQPSRDASPTHDDMECTEVDPPPPYESVVPIVPASAEVADVVDVEPKTPVSQGIDGQLQGDMNRSPSSSIAACPMSPGTVPSKRLYTESWKDRSHTAVQKSTKSLLLRHARPSTVKKETSALAMTIDKQAKKKQKLEGGRFRQLVTDSTTSAAKVARMVASPFISMAERVRRFQMRTPDRFRVHPGSHVSTVTEQAAAPERKVLKLTRPNEPQLQTSNRARPPTVKSAEEIEEEMLAKIPKFKARPLNKKIMEAPTIPIFSKSTPQLPEFQEFHLRTMERACHRDPHGGADQNGQHRTQDHSSRSLNTSMDSDATTVSELKQRRKSAPGCSLTEMHEPHLATAARARPSTLKTTEEMEQEELAKVPKFKARPFNTKIFQSKGDLGIFRNKKRQVTTPQEFHFATDDRLQHNPQLPIKDFSELSLHSHPNHDPLPHPTVPEPFHLETEERGFLKSVKFMTELAERERHEVEARIPKANPLPFTTDYTVVPPKPEPKECTKPEPFHLESLKRHEDEMQRTAEEIARLEQEAAAARVFRAQPIPNLPMFYPERSRKPLTEVQDFQLHVDSRAAERAEFDRKVAEKQNQYKRFREEYVSSRKADEDRVIKAMRKEMVPVARPMPLFSRPFMPQRSCKELTRPVSPRLRIQNRKDRRRTSLTSLSQRRKHQLR